MDKSWINLPRLHDKYLQGVVDFIEFARKNIRKGATEIVCPCNGYRNVKLVNIDVVKEHLVVTGFNRSYTEWIFHGEKMQSTECVIENSSQDNLVSRDEMQDIIRDAFGIHPRFSTHDMGPDMDMGVDMGHDNLPGGGVQGPDEETINFYKLLKEAEQKLYPGCQNYSLLSFLVRLMHIKCLSGWSNKSFTLLLKLLKDVFPKGEILPDSFAASKKLVAGLGLDYYKVHACPRDCMLYWGENAERNDCKVCHKPRYKQFEQQENGPKKVTGKIPHKVVRYFPLIPRLKRLFMSSKTSSLMRWHAENPASDGVMRHPVDSEAWKHFDKLYPDFSFDPRNVRLGLAADGFNPFRTMNVSHSTWPVVVMTYNFPPWLCMKQPYMMLSLIIDGPKAPGNDIDVYLSLIVDELKELWDKGVDTYDALNKEMFKMRVLLLWTINDFPAYANLSGWSTKGHFACPCCHCYTHYIQLAHGKKTCYLGHRRFLDKDHEFRFDANGFDGTIELNECPTRLSGPEVLAMFPENFENKFGKEDTESEVPNVRKKRKRRDDDDYGEGGTNLLYNWKKKSIFFDLPYWKDNLIRHNLDVMHIEKNVCDNVVNTIMNVKGKGKDGKNARMDLKEMGIRKKLHPQTRAGLKTLYPKACFAMDNKNKLMFCNLLKRLKVPDGYASNISRCVNVKQQTLSGLKSHDSHILMEHLLPIAIRRTLPKKVSKVLIELCNFFRQLCSKVLKVDDLDRLQSRIALILCHLERIFPPSFFDIMEHLPIHLAEEAKIGGPVQYRWMYFIERYLGALKSYVRNRARPEGSIAEGYLVEECMTFCSRYLDDTESKLNRPIRNYDGVDNDGLTRGRSLGKEEKFSLKGIQKSQAHRYILFNTDAVTPYREKHREVLRQGNRRIRDHEVDRLHHDTFLIWFQNHVHHLRVATSEEVSEEIADLAVGPRDTATRYSGYFINGVRYHTKERELNRKTQNSGVMLKASTSSYASARDMNPQEGEVTYYGQVTDIIELYYAQNRKYVLFNCDWICNNRGLREDEFGFTLVNFSRLLYTMEHASNEPFILASQAQQVFYVSVEEGWSIVIQMKPRDLFEVSSGDDITDVMEVDGVIGDFEVDGIRQQHLDNLETYSSDDQESNDDQEDDDLVGDDTMGSPIDDDNEIL